MAAKTIKVAVLEGEFADLCNLGLPFSVIFQLQEKGLKLPEALWTVKSSGSGFSFCFYWPDSKAKSNNSGMNSEDGSPIKAHAAAPHGMQSDSVTVTSASPDKINTPAVNKSASEMELRLGKGY
jgi:hypothetical protein